MRGDRHVAKVVFTEYGNDYIRVASGVLVMVLV